ncbi:hypothetical protein [uncultured Microscilla sp.]|uniref:hypothetical protein n=1 Tax=uncultured Microscilla sp. TaxID=432653 RepID=UPI00262B654B|nr:hypothetical protein [uncultured Microscilla sp.]
MNEFNKRTRKRIARKVTILQKIYESNIDNFTASDLRNLNAWLLYNVWQEPDSLPVQVITFGNEQIRLFKFPASFAHQIETRITSYFKQKDKCSQVSA